MRRHSLRTNAGSRAEAELLRRPVAAERNARANASRVAHNFSGVPALQAKLKVGAAGDRYEQEADRVAEEVMRTPEPRIQRKCGCGGSCGDCKKSGDDEVHRSLQRKSVSGADADLDEAPAQVEDVLRTGGAPLDAATRASMEPHFGHDFANVRVHSGERAAQAADAVGARAYTVGRHIVFGAGEYRPGSSEGRRLLAHELTHVTQQGGSVLARVQRDKKPQQAAPDAPAPGSAGAAPRLDYKPAVKTPAAACLVFMHHDEANAHLYANLMHQNCRYNLAIVAGNDPDKRRVKAGTSDVDPNELFPQDVAKECWANPQPCIDYVNANRKSTKDAVIRKSMERQFFVAIWNCSEGFKLPVIGLHNNAISDTARYRRARDARAKALAKTPPPTGAVAPDLEGIRGKTYYSPGETATTGTSPFADLETWLEKNVEGVKKRDTTPDKIKHKKPTLKTPPMAKDSKDKDLPELLTPKQTNIFLWCSSDDNTMCHIGDPERPDNVVWTTNRDDFNELAKTNVNVVLQTTDNDTDLSTLFIKLPKISAEFKALRERLEKQLPLDAGTLQRTYANVLELYKAQGVVSPEAWTKLGSALTPTVALLVRGMALMQARAVKELKADELHFINIETPKNPTQGESAEDLRTQSFRDIKATLATVGLDFCDTAGTQGVERGIEKRNKK